MLHEPSEEKQFGWMSSSLNEDDVDMVGPDWAETVKYAGDAEGDCW